MAKKRNTPEDPVALLGSNIQPSTFTLVDGTELQLGEIVRRAVETSGLSTEDWNSLSRSEPDKTEALIQAEVDKLELAPDEDSDEDDDSNEEEEDLEDGSETEGEEVDGVTVEGTGTPDFMQDIKNFHEKFGVNYNGKPRMLDKELQDFRTRFMQEELDEWKKENGVMESELKENHKIRFQQSMEKSIDALVDLAYVCLGTAYLHGYDFNEAWRRVHAKNMAKERATRAEQSTRGTALDVIKPEGWTPPDHSDLVEDNAHVRSFQ